MFYAMNPPCPDDAIFYDTCLYDSVTMAKWAAAYVKQLPPVVNIVLMTASTSGAVLAAAIMVVANQDDYRLSHCHVHPDNRISHRGETKRTSGVSIKNIVRPVVIVDDFIDSGATVQVLIDKCRTNSLHLDRIIVSNSFIGCAVLGDFAEKNKVSIYFANGEDAKLYAPKPLSSDKSFTKWENLSLT